MRVLVGCENSGVVRDAFRARGHDAWSCDLLESDRQGPHIVGDVLGVISDGWDLGIFHPPCTYLAGSGWSWTVSGIRSIDLTEDALRFVRLLMAAPIPKICIENPVGRINAEIRLPDQIIQPYQFGHDASKRTCLWLKGLPKLVSTHFVAPKMLCCGKFYGGNICDVCNGASKPKKRWANQTPSGADKTGSLAKDRWKVRAKTYEGIALAMASQWG